MEGDLEETRKKGEDIRKEYDRLEAEIRSLEEAVLKERSRFNEASMEKNTLEGRINVLREQIHAEERNEEHIKSRKEAITEELKGKEEQLAEQNRIGEQNTEELNRLNRARQEISEKENHISHLEAVIEEANAQMLRFLNEKAELTARQQRYEAMSEQVNLRRSEVSQKLLRFKSDESLQEERIAEEKEHLSQVQAELL